MADNLAPARPRLPPAWVGRAVNSFIGLVLRSPLHGLMSGALMLLTYTGRRTGRSHTIPIGYFPWRENEVIGFTTIARWPVNLKDGRAVRLRLRGARRQAIPTIASSAQRPLLLVEFVSRYGRAGGPLPMLGVPQDRDPTAEELQVAAGKMTIVFFALKDEART